MKDSKEITALPAPAGNSARWEERTVTRVLESGREQLLERSRLIVEASDQLLQEEGLDGLTIRAVLKKTGLSRRAFYERFAGKDDLMLAVFEESIRQAARHYQPVIQAIDDPLERLRVVVVTIVLGTSSLEDQPRKREEEAIHRRSAAMAREHMRLAESRPEDLQEALQPLIGLMARQLALGMKLGAVRQSDPLRLAMLVYNLLATTVHTELLAQEVEGPNYGHRRELAADLWEFCRRAIMA